MSRPHADRGVRETALRACCAVGLVLLLSCCGGSPSGAQGDASAASSQAAAANEATTPRTELVQDFRNTDLGCGWVPTSRMDLRYARCYTVDYFEGGYALACLADGARYLVVPEGAEVPEGLADDITVVHKPLSDVYLVASDSMCLFDALDALDVITVSGIARDDWAIEAAREAMDDGRIAYGGKYRAPDYELLLAQGVRLAIESSMVNHVPEVREKLVELGIPVLVELSSYESEPLGRAEWVRLYGLLCDRQERADACFQEQVDQVEGIEAAPQGKTVAFFYLNGSGAAVVRRPGDYVTRMIEQAGGSYAFDGLEPATLGASSTTLQMEQFYAMGKDADVVIYNASIDDSVTSLDELLAANELLADFKAVREGNVWLCERDMYQQMLQAGTVISDLNRILCGARDDQTFLRRLD